MLGNRNIGVRALCRGRGSSQMQERNRAGGFGGLLPTDPLLPPPEWRSGVAGHLTLSDLDVTSVTHNQWKRLNTLQHYKVGPDTRGPFALGGLDARVSSTWGAQTIGLLLCFLSCESGRNGELGHLGPLPALGGERGLMG